MNLLFSVLSGLIFGLGLIVSGMTNPAKVLGFLDLAGTWDRFAGTGVARPLPSVSWPLLLSKNPACPTPLPVHLFADGKTVDRRLIAGGLTFGVGWGLAGICRAGKVVHPLQRRHSPKWIFAGAMLAGMAINELLERRKS